MAGGHPHNPEHFSFLWCFRGRYRHMTGQSNYQEDQRKNLHFSTLEWEDKFIRWYKSSFGAIQGYDHTFLGSCATEFVQ